jgi:hypothetical protein
MATEKQILANRGNAKKSTGPKTEEGKLRTSLNAMRHGLTGQVTLMPEEDRKAFKQFCDEIVASFNPATPMERQIVHSIAADNWRLNRMRAMEDNILALGHSTPAAEAETGHPEIHAAVTAARVYSDDPQQFQLLSLYIQRTNREIHRSLKLLQDLSATSGRESIGFVFSNNLLSGKKQAA